MNDDNKNNEFDELQENLNRIDSLHKKISIIIS